MLAFHNDPAIKEKYLRRVIAHRKAGQIIQGISWDGKKGCAVGCTLELAGNSSGMLNGRHIYEEYEIQLGIPRILGSLQDQIFEGLENKGPEFFPEHFLSAANVGADLKKVWPQFAVWLLVDPTDGVIKYAKDKEVIKAILHVADLYQQIDHVAKEQWRNAAYAAYAASDAASDAADWAVNAVAYAALHAADGAVTAAARAADWAVSAAVYATADAAGYPTLEVAQTAYRKQANKLIEIISNTKREI